MKKVYALLVMALFATAVSAQNFVVSPTEFNGSPIQLLGENMSANRQYVAGADQGLSCPYIWNTQTNDLMFIVVNDSAYREYDDGTGFWERITMTGSFHSVNNNGVAVGSLTDANYVSHPIMATINENNNFTYLYTNPDDAGCEAYAISADGNTIVGFYFDEAWTTTPCLWNADGSVRTDLPTPTAEQVGFAIDYASARWISDDASTILGYVQDFNTGAWVAVAWRLVNGQYEVLPLANNFFQTTYWDDNGNFISGENPYFDFTPASISADGQWVALTVLEAYDVTDWDANATPKMARMNLNTMNIEVLTLDESYDANEAFGISNNGTCVGRLTGEFDWNTMEQPVDGIIWNAGDSTIVRLTELYPTDEYSANIYASSLSTITGEGDFAMGYAATESGVWTSFIVALPVQEEPVAIEEAEARIALYPNPATTQVNVSVDSKINHIAVVNAMGQVVYTQNNVNANNVTINTQNMVAGIYFVSVATENAMITKRISIVK